MEALLGRMLQKHLGAILLDFNPRKNTKFKFSLGSGQQMILKDLRVDPTWLAKLIPGLPFVITSGRIDYIIIHARIQSMKSEPMSVEIGRIHLEIKEPANIVPYDVCPETGDAWSQGEPAQPAGAGSGSSSREGEKKSVTRESDKHCTNQFHETRNGTWRKRVKKNYTLMQKIWHGIHWKIKEIHLEISTLGESKAESPGINLTAPPTINVFVRDLDLYSTDENGNICDLKRARAYSKFLDDEVYVFKKGSCFLSVNLTPSNPWFPEVSVFEGCSFQFEYVNLFEPKWQNAKGEDVTLDKMSSIEITSTEPLICHLDGEDLLHVGESFKGVFSAFSRTDIPFDPFKYGQFTRDTFVFKMDIPELVISAILDGPSVSAPHLRRGLALSVNNLAMGYVVGPSDYEKTTQVEIGAFSLFDLADPCCLYLQAPWRTSTDEEDLQELQIPEVKFWIVHPLRAEEAEELASVKVYGRKRKFLRFEWKSCTMMFSDFRPPEPILEHSVFAFIDSLKVSMVEGFVDYAMCIQTLVAMGLALESVPVPDESGSPHRRQPSMSLFDKSLVQDGEQHFETPSILVLRFRFDIRIIHPMISVEIPAEDGKDVHLYLHVNQLMVICEGNNTHKDDGLVNVISCESIVPECGLYCDDPTFSVPVSSTNSARKVLGPDIYALVWIHRIEFRGRMEVEGIAGSLNEGQVRAIILPFNVRDVGLSIHSKHLHRLLLGLSQRYQPAMSTLNTLGQAGRASEKEEAMAASKSEPELVKPPVITVNLAVGSASLFVVGSGISSLEDVQKGGGTGGGGGGGGGGGSENAWIRLTAKGEANFQLIKDVLTQLDVTIPVTNLVSRGKRVIWQAETNDPLAVVTFQRAELDEILKKRFVPPTLGWEKVVVHVQGLRMQVDHGLVTDIANFIADLAGVQSIGRDIGVIVREVFKVVSWTSSSTSKRGASQSHEKEKLALNDIRSAVHTIRSAMSLRPNKLQSNLTALHGRRRQEEEGRVTSPVKKREDNSDSIKLNSFTLELGNDFNSTSLNSPPLNSLPPSLNSPPADDSMDVAGVDRLNLVAKKFISRVPEELEIFLRDCRMEIVPSDSSEMHQAQANVSFDDISLTRTQRKHKLDKANEWDGLLLEVKALQLIDMRQEEAAISTRDMSKSGEFEDAVGEDQSMLSPGRMTRDALQAISLLRPFGVSVQVKWRREGFFRPHFQVYGDAIDLVMQPPILLTLMGVLYEFEILRARAEPAGNLSSSQDHDSHRQDRLRVRGHLGKGSEAGRQGSEGATGKTVGDQQGRAEEEGTMTCTSEELSNLQQGRESKEISRDDAHHQIDILKRKMTRMRKEQEEVKRLAQRQQQHQRNTRVLLDSAREMLTDMTPEASSKADYAMVLQLLDDLALETAAADEDLDMLVRVTQGTERKRKGEQSSTAGEAYPRRSSDGFAASGYTFED